MAECEHDKCYSNYILLCIPPKYPWICRKCGTKGIDTGSYYEVGEYDRLKRMKNLRGEAE